mmetsp:Transcript_37195/g.72115  ORF Transcript_37195/g.72115 Transcript_37195/m.72115 type:complete len:210 (-) Transcript_37195:64-693(-)
MFSLTKRLKEAVSLTNKLDQKRFPKVLGRVIQKLGDHQATRIFTVDEEQQLAGILGLDQSELEMMLSLSRYVFEQAAYHNSSASNLMKSLQEAGMVDTAAEAFATVWKASRGGMIKKLQRYTLGTPKVLTGTDWRFRLKMSTKSIEKEKELKSVLRMTLGAPSYDTDGSDGIGALGGEQISLELGKDDLVDLYSKLEKIQTQIDALTKK